MNSSLFCVYRLVLLLLICVAGIATPAFAQSFQRWTEVPFLHSGAALPNAQAGGMNETQFSVIDLDETGELDLFLFDRSGDKVLTFVADASVENGYRHAPEYQTHFPEMRHWALLRDLTCDGKPELFTSQSDSNGVRIYRNTTQNGALSFELWTDLLMTPEGKAYAAISDIPGIADLDEDGDLDLLSFDSGGSHVRWYENQGNGDCEALTFTIGSNCWGEFSEAGLTNDITLNVACKRGEGEENPAAHAGSSICIFDQDGDGAKELILGDLNNSNLVYLHNGGTPTDAMMDLDVPDYPTNSVPLDMRQFPGAFYVDVSGDALGDLLVTPNISGVSLNVKNVWYYENVGTANDQVFVLREKDFLQSGMIDLGRAAKPALVDYNADGLMDIVVGNYLYRAEPEEEVSRLSLYRNRGTAEVPAFERVTNNYLNLPALFNPPRLGLHPTFGDLDQDGDDDLVIGDEIGNLHRFVNTANAGQPASFQLVEAVLAGIDIGGNAAPQIVDVDRDGLPDLLVGERSGNVNFFRNIGTATSPLFHKDSVNSNFGEIDVYQPCCTGYSVPFLFENGKGERELLVGSEFNELHHYTNIDNNLDGTFTLSSLNYGEIDEGSRLAPVGADLNADGRQDWVIGNERGGIALYRGEASMAISPEILAPPSFQLWPNPGQDELHLSWANPVSVEEIKLFSLSGQLVRQHTPPRNASETSLYLPGFPPGIYLLSVHSSEGIWHKKWMKQ